MKLTVDKRYLVIPVAFYTDPSHVQFYKDDELVFDMEICLSAERTDAVYYQDFRDFMGMELEVKGLPEGVEIFATADEEDDTGIYSEERRPAVHFTAKRGWINDPNGCIKIGDTYHLFFQHNPVGRIWGNMTWGHAISKDLIHWQQLEEALFPDQFGTMYSGSGWLDKENASGLGTEENPPALFMYTASGNVNEMSRLRGYDYTQCLAYSLDGGMTLKKYENNPVVPWVTHSNRDPLINYSDEMGCYVMALYYYDNEYALYRSEDLLHWELTQQITLPDAAECPDFFKLKVEGEDKAYWIYIGANDRYLVGELSPEGHFTPIQEVQRLHYGNSSYAGQSFSHIDDGRHIRITWANGDIPGQIFNCAMAIPQELKLVRYGRARKWNA